MPHCVDRGDLGVVERAKGRSPLLQETMQNVFATTDIHPVTYHNRHVHEEFTDWLYVGRRGDSTEGDEN